MYLKHRDNQEHNKTNISINSRAGAELEGGKSAQYRADMELDGGFSLWGGIEHGAMRVAGPRGCNEGDRSGKAALVCRNNEKVGGSRKEGTVGEGMEGLLVW